MILLDTHVVAWLAFDPAKVSAHARAAINEARSSAGGLAISDITLLELARSATKGCMRLGMSVESFLGDVEGRFVVLPMNGKVCVRAMTLPASYPRDPADRVIAATALVEGLPLLTADPEIRKSRVVRTIW